VSGEKRDLAEALTAFHRALVDLSDRITALEERLERLEDKVWDRNGEDE
jgi:ubiquinone biosynthesis protein UbiJ